MPKQPRSFVELSVELAGKTYSASYSVSSSVVTVNSVYGSNSTQVGGSTAEIIARLLFREILEGAKSHGGL